MDKKLIEAQDVLLSKISQMCSRFGLNNVMAQLYAILYLSNKPLCLDDMVERLKISKGSASVNIRALERYGVVRQIWVKGSRKDYYEAEADISRVIVERISSMAKGRLSEVDKMINLSSEAINAVSSTNKEDAESVRIFRERLEKMRSFYNQAKSLFELFNMSFINSKFAPETKEASDQYESGLVRDVFQEKTA
jgi:DNA-binding transcriptional regulator GbsR (MarR family)